MSSRGRSTAGGSELGAAGGVPDLVVTDETIEPEITNPGFSCQMCQGPDTEDMVRCDVCLKWHHFVCVGVTREIEHHPWSCFKCGSAPMCSGTITNPDNTLHAGTGATKKQQGGTSNKLPGNHPTPGKLSTDLQTPKPAGKKGPRTRTTQAEDLEKKKREELEKKKREELEKKKQEDLEKKTRKAKSVVEQINPGNPKKAPSIASKVSGRSAQALAKLKLQRLEEEKALQEKALEQEKTYLAEKYRLMEEMVCSETNSVVGDAMKNVEEWINKQQKGYDVRSVFTPQGHSSKKSQEEDNDPGEFDHCSCSAIVSAIPSSGIPSAAHSSKRSLHESNGPRVEQESGHRSCPIIINATPLLSNHPATHPTVVQPADHRTQRREDDCALTKRQLAARQAISKDLPQFSGSANDWYLFVSAFNSSTAMCGYTDAENIYRLQRCLKGAAYKSVESLLSHPSNVSRVIAILKMRFAQPERIILTIIDEISALPTIKEGQFELFVDFAVSVQNFCATVDACGLKDYMYNVDLLRRLVDKLPPTIKIAWGQFRLTNPSANLTAFSNWIYPLAEAANAVTIPNTTATKAERGEVRGGKKGNAHAHLNAHSESSSGAHSKDTADSIGNKKSSDNCVVCNGTCKTVDKCKRFLEFSRESRWSTVKDSNLCRRCLRRHYGGCQTKPCGKDGCSLKHHPLLHNDQKSQTAATATQTNPASTRPAMNKREVAANNAESNSHGCHTHQIRSSETLFRYLPVVLQGKGGPIQTYAFLDDGSALTLLDDELATQLQLDGTTKPLCLHWTGGTQRQEAESRSVDLKIAGDYSGAKHYTMKGVRTVKELLLPHQSMNIEELSHLYPHLSRLPLQSYEDIRPRILIGLKDQHLSLTLKSREGKPCQPIAVKTRLGWTVCGGRSQDDISSLVHSVFHMCSCEEPTDECLHRAMKEYFALDSIGITTPSEPLVSLEDQRAQTLLQTQTKYNGRRFETGLLWRHDNARLPDSKAMALRRFHCLEKRMLKDPDLAEMLNQKIADYISKGYIRKLTKEELKEVYQRIWYLPVFPVTNPNKPGKWRMVWDAAAKVFDVSLNSALLKGPDQLISLLAVLIMFREHSIGLTGDIREMFHQVMMQKDDQQCQRFLWRDEDGEIAVYVMCVMTFGACCSPSCAQYVKDTNADRFVNEYPEAVHVIKQQHYVDDMLVSVDTEDEAIRLAQQVKFVHSQGGFEIRNWISNSKRVIESLHESNTQEKNLDLSPEMATEKVLGMWWNTASDIFTYKVGWTRHDQDLLGGRRCPTKRDVLRILMTIFDPLGLIAPFLMYLKILLQEIWRTGTLWDERINAELFEKWQLWLRILPQVERVEIPRCYRIRTSKSCTDIQLHTFVDASANGTAACCYLRFSENGTIECTLVAAKTRVSSLKLISIPRLELQAALLGTRLAKTVLQALTLKISEVTYWSDSRDVLCWINSDYRRYTPFVGFRLANIREDSNPEQWRWVPTKSNVADDGTKWARFPDMTPDSRWYKGPEFLRLREEEWPQPLKKGTTTDTELRPSMMAHFTKPEPLIDTTRFSTWKRLVRFTALLYRFPTYCRLSPQERNHSITAELLRKAENFLIRQAQREIYADEVAALTTTKENSKEITKSSPLFRYTPWLDENGLLRMRGRIDDCLYASEDTKNPIILPPTHHTTSLIMHHYHIKYNHQNHQTAINELRQRFCIPRLRREFSKTRSNCQLCKNNRAKPQPPLMAQLPFDRLDAYQAPFTHIGIDYFGPIEVTVGRRVEKRWGMLITCMTMRAIHIEVVHSLSTNSCIMGIRNFMARRGTPRTIYSDHGTCFVGASRELRKNEAALNMDEVMREFISAETTWKFITPASPHMGGSWERMVGIVKKNLMTIRPTPRPNDEVLRNMLTEIENTVNSRPLTDLSIDDEFAPALTPNHFLLLSSNGTKPLSHLDDNGSYLGQSYKASQRLADIFWKRWVNEFLPDITRRTKWYANTKLIAIGDVVVVVDPKLPRNCWPKGRVIGTIPGKDGKARSATVRTAAGGIYERAVANLAILDVRRE